MEKINFLTLNQYNKEKAIKSQPAKNIRQSISETNYNVYSSAISAYGKANISFKGIGAELNRLESLIESTDNTETISLDDAVKEMNGINTTNKNRTEFILACTFETDNPELIINKKAIYTLKNHILSYGQVPKLTKALRACMDENSLSFNDTKFDSMFNLKGQVKYSANVKPSPQNYEKHLRDIKSQKRLTILNAVENNLPENNNSVEFKQSEWFIPISTKRQEMIDELNRIETISDDLKMNIKSELEKDNFNIKEIYKQHYSYLNDCKTREDVKTLYPELQFVEEQPTYDKSTHKHGLQNRLALADYDRVVIDMFKMGHLQLKPTNTIYVDLENSSPTSYTSLKNAGFAFTMPSPEITSLMKKGEELTNRYKNIPHLESEEIDKLAQKHAIKTSKFWSDYTELTSTKWMPIRWINNKQAYPDKTKYTTEKLTNAYLLGLYLHHRNREHSANPLEKYDELNYLSPPMANVIHNTYWTVHDEYKTDFAKQIKKPDFIEFTKQFDKQAIGKSIEHLEKNFKTSFFKGYWTNDRKNNIKNNLQTSYDLIYEKILLKEEIERKIVTEKDVEQLIDEKLNMTSTSAIDEKKYTKFKYIISNIKNQNLKERCQGCVSDPNFVDIDYFETLYNIIDNSIDKETETLDESKATVLIALHDEYMTHVMNSDNKETEEAFINQRLDRYKNSDGTINYNKYFSNAQTFLDYKTISEELTKKGDTEIISFVNNKYLSSTNPDYTSASSILNNYDNLPDEFKPKFLTTAKTNSHFESTKLKKTLDDLHSKISSWNFDKDEVIIMDKDTIPQKVIITTSAKQDLWKILGENTETFDKIISKFYSAGTTRTGDEKGQGIKEIKAKNTAELKIKGDYGNLRMFARPVTDSDREKYETDDGIKIKFVFDKCKDHLRKKNRI